MDASDNPTAAQLIDALLDGGEAVDEGSFTLDSAAAAAKMEAFAYHERSRYLIPIVEGLHGLGAREVSLTRLDEDLEIRGAGLRLADATEVLGDLYVYALGFQTDTTKRALGRLAVGLDMVLGDDERSARGARVAVSYSNNAKCVTGVYEHRKAAQLSHSHPEVIGELRILIDRPWTGRLVAAGASHAELEQLRAAVRCSDRVVLLDREPISGQARGWGRAARGAGPGYRFEIGREQRGAVAAQVEVWAEGVCIDTLDQLDSLRDAGLGAVIELDEPRRDLSQMKVVRDETLERALAAIAAAGEEFVKQPEPADVEQTDVTATDGERTDVPPPGAEGDSAPAAAHRASPTRTGMRIGQAGFAILVCLLGVGFGVLGLAMFVDDSSYADSPELLVVGVAFAGLGITMLSKTLARDGRVMRLALILVVIVVVLVTIGASALLVL